jgi:transportin-3
MAINGGGGYKVSAEDSLNLVEALGMVVTELPLDQAKGALEKLCFSAASPLEVCHLDYLHGCLIYCQDL